MQGLQRHSNRPASRVVHGESTARKSVEQSHLRLNCVAVFFALCFGALALRLLEVSLVGGGALPFKRLVSEPHLLVTREAEVEENIAPPQIIRRDITDRNGVVVATSVKTASLAANPTLIRHDRKVAKQLARALPGVSEQGLYKRLSNKHSRFTYIKRHLTPSQQEAVNNLGIPGLFFESDTRRVYPYRELLSHVLGFVDVDNKGLSGMERRLDRALMEPWHEAPIALSIDVRAQSILHDELVSTVKKFSALGGAGIVLDVHTGEVISLVSLPDFDPHNPQKAKSEALFNRASLGTYEMGSVFKAFTLAGALEHDVVGIKSGYDATHPIQVARFSIRDFHPKKRWLSVPEIFAYSSNIGTVKMALDLGTNQLKSFFDKLGLFAPVDTNMPETATPMVPRDWKEINTMTASYGHGISVSPLHVVRAMASLVGDGMLRHVTFTKQNAASAKKTQKVVHEETIHELRNLLRVVVKFGTARSADAAGYALGGKTGTAEKVSGKTYKRDAKIASFLGAFPVYNPRYAILVMVDEPKGIKETYGYATGGWVSAPVARRFVERAAPVLGVAPQHYLQEKVMEAMWFNNSQNTQTRGVRRAAF